MAQPSDYMYFYLIGRQEDELDLPISIRVIAERVVSGEALRDVTLEVAKDAARANVHTNHKRDWVLENNGEIKEAGGNATTAYDLYTQGRIDELANNLEGEVIEEIIDLLADLDDGVDQDDDEGEEDEEVGEEGDEEEEEEEDEEAPDPALAEIGGAKSTTLRRRP